MNKQLLILVYLYEYDFLGLINILWELNEEEITTIFEDFKDWLNQKNQSEAIEYFNTLNLDQFKQDIHNVGVNIKIQIERY